MALQFGKSKRGGDILYVKYFKFHCKRKVGDKLYWNCCVPGCRANCVTRLREELLKGPSAHNGHPPLSPTTVKSSSIMEKMKQRVAEEPQRALQRVYNDVVQEAISSAPEEAGDLACSLPTYDSCRMALHRARKKKAPVLPKQSVDLDVPEDLSTTSARRNYFQVQPDNSDND